MATATRTTTLIQNSEASPVVMNSTLLYGGRKRCILGTIETATADDGTGTAVIYALCKLKASWAVTSIKLFLDAVTSVTDADIGLYTGTVSTSLTAASTTAYGEAVDLSSANLTGLEVAFEARGVEKMGQQVYLDAGDAEGDFSEYWLTIETALDVGAGPDTISFIVEYVDGT